MKLLSEVVISEELNYHLENNLTLAENIFRAGSSKYFSIFNEARVLYRAGALEVTEGDEMFLKETIVGETALYEGKLVYLDFPIPVKDSLSEYKGYELSRFAKYGEYFTKLVDLKKKSEQEYQNFVSNLERIPEKLRKHFEYFIEFIANNPEVVTEAEYQGRKVDLNKPKRGGTKKFYVYTKNPKTGKVIKVAFGAKDGGGNLAVKLKDPERRKAFADRHNCDQKNDKTKPGYWSCRLPRYAKALGLSGASGRWW